MRTCYVLTTISVLLLLSGPAVLAQDPTVVTPPAYAAPSQNYIRSWMAVKPDTSDANFNVNSPLQHSRMTTQYFDGFGRPIQTVTKQGSFPTGGTASDLVQTIVYDDWGRVQRQYLPFAANNFGGNTSINDGMFKVNPFQQQNWFYSNGNPTSPIYGQGETYYYGKTEYEPSPLNRPARSYWAGDNWVHDGKGTGYQYFINTTADSVRRWTVTIGGSPGSFGTYNCDNLNQAGELNKHSITDENGKQVITFVNREGQVVLKKVQNTAAPDTGAGKGYTGWLCTYYIYDVYGLLRCVIQPRGVELLQANGWNPTWNSSVILNEQCFRYEYDGKRRRIIQKLPGASEVYMVYDSRDRLVLLQDANMRNGSPVKWLYTQYDDINRPIATGLWNNSSSIGTHYTAAYNSIAYPNLAGQTYEELSNTFYSNYNWRSSYGNPLSATRVTTYDSYLQTPSDEVYPYPQNATIQSPKIKTLVTGSRTKVLGTAMYLYSVNIYDEMGRIIQVQSTNATGGTDVQTTQYSFIGQPLLLINKTEKAGANAQTTVTVTQITYDDLGRPIKTEKKVSNTTVNSNAMSAYKTLAELQYDALGQLKKKRLAPMGGPGGTPLDSLVYDYNIRGWLLGVNRPYLQDKGGAGYAPNYFAFELGYNKCTTTPGSCADGAFQYNGNISTMVWKSAGDEVRRKYNFWYDEANRFAKADYYQRSSAVAGGSWTNTEANFGVHGFDADNGYKMKYDANGNILSMIQHGITTGNNNLIIDALRYKYKPYSNQLEQVWDDMNAPATTLGDFRWTGTKTGSTIDYTYDANGNMVKDLNKDIVGYNGANGIDYNHLNLASKVTVKKDGVSNKGTVEYLYDAAGNKLKKTVYEPGVDTTVTLYLNGSVYENDTLQFIGHEEGRIRLVRVDSSVCTPQPNRLVYDYFHKDHLGSVRMVLTEQKEDICYPAATVEDTRYQKEDDYYNIVNARRITKATTGATQTSFENKLYRVHGGLTNEKTGLGIVLKVMAGDKVKIMAESFYTLPGGGAGSPLTMAVTELLTAFTGSPAIIDNKGVLTPAQVIGIGTNNTDLASFISNNNPGTNNAKAFVNYLVFDEQLKYISGGTDPVLAGGGYKLHNTYINSPVPISKNGYIYVYVSNESNLPVYFDNLTVTHTPGPILEETHYYPFGLPMAGISSKAAGKLLNKYKYNGIEYESSFNINIGEAFFRTHDPQTGRWFQLDPKPDYSFSLYSAMKNNPTLYSDFWGDTVKLGNLYEKDKSGNYKYINEIVSFELFASTAEGKKYLLQHAEKGFSLKGAYVKGLDIEAKKEGRLSKKGVDIGLSVVDQIPSGDARTEHKIEDGRLKISFMMEKTGFGSSFSDKQGWRDNMLKKVDSWTHEFFLHGDLLEKSFLNGSNIRPYSHDNPSLLASKYGGENTGTVNSSGINILQAVQNMPLNMNQGLKPHSTGYIWYRLMMPGLGYLVPPSDTPKY
jgi:RHS repeat-associated protein